MCVQDQTVKFVSCFHHQNNVLEPAGVVMTSDYHLVPGRPGSRVRVLDVNFRLLWEQVSTGSTCCLVPTETRSWRLVFVFPNRTDLVHTSETSVFVLWTRCFGAFAGWNQDFCRCVFKPALMFVITVEQHFMCRCRNTTNCVCRVSLLLSTGVFTRHTLTLSSRLDPTLCNFVHFA